ncbi:hypothetical protein WJX84_006435 [Apatococcus fuscideae]|uniref:Protein kinase domain-containing protein n=1 Tax=Apatococcus fuscideae TaxID=2026836 RepID=A0AAW1RUF2_9CHLO
MANLLVDADGTMRLADMGGVQKDIVVGKRQGAQRPCTFTPTYCPPEFLRGQLFARYPDVNKARIRMMRTVLKQLLMMIPAARVGGGAKLSLIV